MKHCGLQHRSVKLLYSVKRIGALRKKKTVKLFQGLAVSVRVSPDRQQSITLYVVYVHYGVQEVSRKRSTHSISMSGIGIGRRRVCVRLRSVRAAAAGLAAARRWPLLLLSRLRRSRRARVADATRCVMLLRRGQLDVRRPDSLFLSPNKYKQSTVVYCTALCKCEENNVRLPVQMYTVQQSVN